MARAAEVISKRDCPDNAPRDQITTVFFARRHSASEKTWETPDGDPHDQRGDRQGASLPAASRLPAAASRRAAAGKGEAPEPALVDALVKARLEAADWTSRALPSVAALLTAGRRNVIAGALRGVYFPLIW